MAPYVLGVGAANIDLMGRSREPIVWEDSNPGSIGVSVGGVTHNICENAARMGCAAVLITATGDDLHGQVIRDHCARSGMDTSHFYVVPGHASSSYLSIHQPQGEMAVALSDMSVLQCLPVSYLEERRSLLEGAAVIVADCGLSQEVLDYLLGEIGPRVPIFLDPVSTTYARKLLPTLAGCHTLKPNLLEAELLSGMTISADDDLDRAAARILDKGGQRVFISMGRAGVYYADRAGTRLRAATRPLDLVVNATGAGDAFMAGLVSSFLAGRSLEDTLDFSMTASILAISHAATINPEMSADLIRETIPRYKLT